jgi:exodeoxyribonuclease-1
MKTFLFYDVETSGLNPSFDQILTFASIRCDKNFNEIERNSVIIQLRPDIVPSPQAFIIHRLVDNDLKLGLSEYEAAIKIHKLLNKPGTVSLGYNTLKFDDDFLRFFFYRNLLDPYTHQYSMGCSRMDILPLVTLNYIFNPSIINWPENNGKPSFKLENISKENSLVTSGRAHEAMTDVEATYNLAKILAGRRDIFDYSMGFFNKSQDELRINKFENSIDIGGKSFKLGIVVSHQLGFDNKYMALVINIGKSIKYSNQNLWLRLDKEIILDFIAKPEESMPLLIRKRSGDIPIILPAIDRFYKKLLDDSKKIAEANLKAILNHSNDFFKMVNFYKEFKYPYIPDLDPDAALYQSGFFTKHEKKEISDFHRAGVNDKIKIARQMNSERIKILAQRIMYRNYPSDSEASKLLEATEFNGLMDKLRFSKSERVVKGFKNDIKLNCKNALKELKETRQFAIDDEQKEILNWLQGYIEKI